MAQMKLPYEAPKIREYGNVAEVTRGLPDPTKQLDFFLSNTNFAFS